MADNPACSEISRGGDYRGDPCRSPAYEERGGRPMCWQHANSHDMNEPAPERHMPGSSMMAEFHCAGRCGEQVQVSRVEFRDRGTYDTLIDLEWRWCERLTGWLCPLCAYVEAITPGVLAP